MNMRYVFFGTPEFAAIILEKLIVAGFIPTAIVCNPDRPVGRKKIVTAPAVKILARKHDIKVLQPEQLEIGPPAGGEKFSARGGSAFGGEIGEVDLAVVSAYAKILPKEIVDLPRLGTIGVHPSLLPKFRGASPIRSAILASETETGVTLYLLDEKVDHGAILATSHLPLAASETYETLMKKLAISAGDLLVETLPKFITGEIKPAPQDESKATYTKKFVAENGYIESADLERAQREGGEIAIQIDRKIRAL